MSFSPPLLTYPFTLGHHAAPSLCGGYCYINNVAVAARYAVEKEGINKVAILDIGEMVVTHESARVY